MKADSLLRQVYIVESFGDFLAMLESWIDGSGILFFVRLSNKKVMLQLHKFGIVYGYVMTEAEFRKFAESVGFNAYLIELKPYGGAAK